MKIKHVKGSEWVKRGLFSDIVSFEQLEFRINQPTEEKDRGDVFEIFIEGYLGTVSIALGSEYGTSAQSRRGSPGCCRPSPARQLQGQMG